MFFIVRRVETLARDIDTAAKEKYLMKELHALAKQKHRYKQKKIFRTTINGKQ